MDKIIRIGGACGFLGDSILGPRQLAAVEGMHYLVFDYLAEMTLSSFAHAHRADPQAGFAADFVSVTLRELLPACRQRGIRLVANAGGLNPAGCAAAIEALSRELGCPVRVAWVEGDDCLGLLPGLAASDVRDFYTGAPMPEGITNANAYLGALPIARALALGADIVVTGRIVDSATTLGILMHEFEWPASDFDRLAAGALAGHLLECGAQATGGLYTDWEDVPDWAHIGYPYVEAGADGTFVVCKAPGTGGLLTPATVSEQVLYEVGDPACYVLPDVVCDFSAVRLTQDGAQRVRVEGARGLPPPPTYKVCATFQQGYRCSVQLSVFGADAVRKARRTGDALLARVRELVAASGEDDFDRTAVSVLGAEDAYGPHARPDAGLREALLRIGATHARPAPLALLSREARAAGVSFAPGTTSGSALALDSRAAVEPLYRLFTCLVDKRLLPAPRVLMEGRQHMVPLADVEMAPPRPGPAAAGDCAPAPRSDRRVPLIELAHGRSGDKGDTSNIAVIARRPEDLPLLRRELTPQKVRAYLGHLVHGEVYRYEVPGLGALNFLLTQSLDGGAPSSLRPDPMGKGLAQMLLGMPVSAD
ncbi:acyclic terpene utilization AtuA family protein [Variovorax sp.]|uniref:acyclic terpene utilization AtuA family protein n=1 Tax=Variovorax sp. TaxID=1871043 RepID=UPI002D68D32F|nr:acyclic terpene utilization AtuA family protein [Variovorax sp.]HYP85787.1 acyclic terpene utilization AtuA family protein [Variovorax sp.]